MKLQYKLVFKQGLRTVAEVFGRPDVVDTEHFTVSEVEDIIKTEAFLERLTGLRVHIEQV